MTGGGAEVRTNNEDSRSMVRRNRTKMNSRVPSKALVEISLKMARLRIRITNYCPATSAGGGTTGGRLPSFSALLNSTLSNSSDGQVTEAGTIAERMPTQLKPEPLLM